MWLSLFSRAHRLEGILGSLSLGPSCLTCSASFGQQELGLPQDWKLFDIITFFILLGYSNKEQWPLTPTGRYNENTARSTVPDTSRINKPEFFPASMTLAPLWLLAQTATWATWNPDLETQPTSMENWVMPSNHLRWIFPIFWTQSKRTFNVLTSKLKQKQLSRIRSLAFTGNL